MLTPADVADVLPLVRAQLLSGYAPASEATESAMYPIRDTIDNKVGRTFGQPNFVRF